MKEIVKLGFVLWLICVIAATALGVTNEMTKDTIVENTNEANRLARIEVFPQASDFVLLADRGTEDKMNEVAESLLEAHDTIADIYEAKDASGVIGYVMTTKPEGYGGAIGVIIGFELDGTITGVRVGDHQETPGLGAKAKTEDFYNQYMGLKADGNIFVKKEKVAEGENAIQAITSATITSVAVTEGVNMSKVVLEAFK